MEKQVKGAIISAKLHYLNGKEDVIELKLPVLGKSLDSYWTATTHLKTYINQLAAFYIRITGFDFTLSFEFENGQIEKLSESEFFEIPLNKVWHPAKGWITLEKAKKLRSKMVT